jgi:hypothetical protein
MVIVTPIRVFRIIYRKIFGHVHLTLHTTFPSTVLPCFELIHSKACDMLYISLRFFRHHSFRFSLSSSRTKRMYTNRTINVSGLTRSVTKLIISQYQFLLHVSMKGRRFVVTNKKLRKIIDTMLTLAIVHKNIVNKFGHRLADNRRRTNYRTPRIPLLHNVIKIIKNTN